MMYSNFAFAQIQETCTGCVHIPLEEVNLYKTLFPLTIWTDETIYDHNSIITLSGHLRPDNTFNPITITVTNPIGNIVAIEQITPMPSGDFSVEFNTSSNLWKKDGTYVIKAQSGQQTRLFKTDIELISLDLGSKSECSLNEVKAEADNGGIYCIPFSVTGEITGIEGFLTTTTNTLTLNLRGTGVELITLELPRYILDSKSSDGTDSPFVILLNGISIDYEELFSFSDSERKIKIIYPPDREGKIEIIGTQAVPEFGSMGLMVLLFAISAIVVISARKNSIKGLLSSY